MNRTTEQAVRQRAAERCEYCHLPQALTKLKFSLDHIRARKHGGTDALENLAFACGYCNRHKGPNIAGVDPASGQMTRLFNPRLDMWIEHFAWQGAVIVGMTSIGRATVAVLAMNGSPQLALRRALLGEGAFPLP